MSSPQVDVSTKSEVELLEELHTIALRHASAKLSVRNSLLEKWASNKCETSLQAFKLAESEYDSAFVEEHRLFVRLAQATENFHISNHLKMGGQHD